MMTLLLLYSLIFLTACTDRPTVPVVFTDSTNKESMLIKSNDIGEFVSRESLYHFGYENIKNHDILLKLEVYSNGNRIDTMNKRYLPLEPNGNIGLQFIHFTKHNGQKYIQWIMEINNNLTSLTTEDVFADSKEYSIETIQREAPKEGNKIPLLIYYSDEISGSDEKVDDQEKITSYINMYRHVSILSLEILEK